MLRRSTTIIAAVVTLTTVVIATKPAQAQAADPTLAGHIEVTAGVGDPDPNAVVQTLAADAAVWDIEVIGNTVYVGGTFTTITEKYDKARHQRNYLAAFDGTTGEWIDQWLPTLDGPVYSLDSTPDGDLIVGGEFTVVNGRSDRAGLVALDAVTGEVVGGFVTHVERRWTDAPMVVRDLFSVEGRLYVAGNFNHVNGTRVYKAVRVDRATGQLDRSFIPAVTGNSVYAIAESPDGQRVHLGGAFSAVGAQPGTAILATVGAADGALTPGWSWDFQTFCCKAPKVLAMDIAGDNLFVGGSNDFWAMVSSATGETRRLQPQSQVQDIQVIEVLGDRVYIGCHCSKRGDWMDVVDAATGADLESFSSTWGGSDGGWAADIAPDGCLWSGGAFDSGLRSDGVRVFAGNLIRTCPVSGPIDHGIPAITPPGPPASFECVVEPGARGVTISWTDIGARGYDVIEDGGAKRWVRTTEAIDPTPGTSYRVTAWGNGQSGRTVTCDNPAPGGGGGFTCVVEDGPGPTVQISWTDLGARGYDVIEDEGTKRWTTSATVIDATPGTSYRIVAWGNGVSGETSDVCTNPAPGGRFVFECTLTPQADGSVVVSWSDLGARGYDVIEDQDPKRWTRSTELVDTTPGSTYRVVAWGNGFAGEETSCGAVPIN
ncbi:MAG: hypothetical protein AAF547_24895 [Actinomycetota bacterium]